MNIHISRLTCTFFAWSWSSEAAPVWSDYLALLKHAYNVKQKKVGKSQLTFQGEDLVVFCLTQERFGKDRRFAHMFSLSDLSIDWQFIDTGCVVNTIMGAAFRWMTLAHLHIFVDLLVYPCILDTFRLTYHAWQFLSWYLWRFFSMCVPILRVQYPGSFPRLQRRLQSKQSFPHRSWTSRPHFSIKSHSSNLIGFIRWTSWLR